jgi:hypothetical protein
MFKVSPSFLMLILGWVATAPDSRADDFRDTIGPILESRCVRCHGGTSTKGGLSLATAKGARRGGESGPAVEPGRPDESLLLDMVSGEAPMMPKDGNPLKAEEVAALRRWIAQGAPWPDGVTLAERKADAGPWWAVQPLGRPEIPAVSDANWVRTPVDAFILARLDTKGLRPRREADRRTLIRRVTFDLTGLPPTPGEVAAFLDDERPDAYERLVDRLLASPGYGERWARHWLDVVHYADTHGYDKDKRRDHAWPYRDAVIRAFNADVPYAEFVRAQLAGDVLRPGDPDAVAATGFVAAGPWDFVGHVELAEDTVEKMKTRLIDRDDMVANAMSTFVSLTVHCARCHDHKFDPIPQRDYYRLQAVFAGVDRGDRPLSGSEASPDALVYALVSHEPRPIRVLNRGEVEQPGEPVGPGALGCVPGLEAEFTNVADGPEGARRAALADWIVDRVNPLTWRSIVNRVWHYHFGRGLVETPSDFGRNGGTPTHPELLDWLAVEFRDGGQSFKSLHRLIVTSATYRQASEHNESAAAIDAENRLLWRQNRRRLEAEEVRDAVLACAGHLDRQMYGPGFEVFRFKDDHSPTYDHEDREAVLKPEGQRRAMYRFSVRSVPNPWIDCMDGADPNANVPVRNATITALQALALLNDPFMLAQADEFAARLEVMHDDPCRRIDAAFGIALGRTPDADERAALVAYAEKHGLAAACRVILNLNEFLFVD